MQDSVMQSRWDAGLDACRAGGMQDRWDAGKEGCTTGGMQDRRDAGKEGCREGGQVGCRKEGIYEGRDATHGSNISYLIYHL